MIRYSHRDIFFVKSEATWIQFLNVLLICNSILGTISWNSNMSRKKYIQRCHINYRKHYIWYNMAHFFMTRFMWTHNHDSGLYDFVVLLLLTKGSLGSLHSSTYFWDGIYGVLNIQILFKSTQQIYSFWRMVSILRSV